jgi:hypothetical protein
MIPAPPGWSASRAKRWAVISLLGLVAELTIAASTVLPGAPLVPQWVEFALIPGTFIVFGHAALFQGIGGLRPRALVSDLGGPTATAFAALFATAWLVSLWSIAHIGGQPETIHGRYYLNNHGTYKQVSHNAYLHALVLQQRIFTLIPSVFYAAATLAHRGKG